MSRRAHGVVSFGVALTAAAAVALLMPARPTAQSQAQGKTGQVRLTSPKVQLPAHQDTSPALRSIPPQAPIVRGHATHPPRHLPGRDRARGTALAPGADAGLQTADGVAGKMPSPALSFNGINNVSGVAPPDTDGDVGPDHYVQFINLAFAIYDKSGTKLYGPADGNTLWTGFGGVCETSNDGDPIVLYDQLADRWLMSQFALPNFPSGPYYECIAISTTGDPLGTWYRYAFVASTTKMNDYPKLGVWPDGYYMSVNQFTNGASWGGAGVFVFERSAMLTGAAARQVYFDLYSVDAGLGGMLPTDLDGATLPPAGSPNYFIEADDDGWGWDVDMLQVFKFHVDWTTPANSTFTGPQRVDLTAAGYPFDSDMCGGSRNCIAQQGVTQKVDALSDRLMHRLAYRNFGTHESLVMNHTVDVGSDRAGIRWYELRNPGGAPPTLHQAGTYAPADSLNRWMGSIAMDAAGNAALGYSTSSSASYPSIKYTGRLEGDTLGTMGQGEATLVAGSASQNGVNRWGDYSSMNVDPVDDCTFWYTQEYVSTAGSWNWNTRIGSFKFPSCAAPEAGTLSGTVTDDDTGDPIAGALVEIGGQSDTTAADGTYSIASVPVGTYDVTASKAGYTSSTVNDVAITDGNTTTQDFALTPVPGPGTLTGTITNSATGLPVLGAVVTVDGMTRTTPANGVYTFADIAAGTYDVTVTKTGFFAKTVDDVAVASGGTTTQNIAIDPIGTFKGKVNRKGAVGVAGATVNAKQGGVTKHTTTSGPTGQYTLPVIAGTYDLEFSAPGYFTQTKAAQTVIAGKSKPVTVTLQRPGGIQGEVKQVRTTTLLDDVLVELFKGGVFQTSMTTSAGGYSFTGLVPGPGYSLRFSKAGFVTKTIGRAVPDGATATANVSLRPAL
jgi:hypothetical protein